MRTKKFLLQYHWILALGHLLDIVKKIITILSIQLAPNNHFYTFVEIHNFVSKQLDPCDNRYIYIQLYTNTMMIRSDALMIRTDTCLFIYLSIHWRFVDDIRIDSVTIIVFVCSFMGNLNCNNHNLPISSTLHSGFVPISNIWGQTQKQLHFRHRWTDDLFLGALWFCAFWTVKSYNINVEKFNNGQSTALQILFLQPTDIWEVWQEVLQVQSGW